MHDIPSITLHWTLAWGHVGIPENKEVDPAAKEAVQGNFMKGKKNLPNPLQGPREKWKNLPQSKSKAKQQINPDLKALWQKILKIPKSLFVCAIDPLLSLEKFQSLTNNSFINVTLALYSNCTQVQTSSLPISSQTPKCPHYQMHLLLYCLQYSHHLTNEVPLSGQS